MRKKFNYAITFLIFFLFTLTGCKKKKQIIDIYIHPTFMYDAQFIFNNLNPNKASLYFKRIYKNKILFEQNILLNSEELEEITLITKENDFLILKTDTSKSLLDGYSIKVLVKENEISNEFISWYSNNENSKKISRVINVFLKVMRKYVVENDKNMLDYLLE